MITPGTLGNRVQSLGRIASRIRPELIACSQVQREAWGDFNVILDEAKNSALRPVEKSRAGVSQRSTRLARYQIIDELCVEEYQLSPTLRDRKNCG